METEDEKPLVPSANDENADDLPQEELTGCGASLPCDPRRNLHRYLVLIVMCFLSFGEFRLALSVGMPI